MLSGFAAMFRKLIAPNRAKSLETVRQEQEGAAMATLPDVERERSKERRSDECAEAQNEFGYAPRPVGPMHALLARPLAEVRIHSTDPGTRHSL